MCVQSLRKGSQLLILVKYCYYNLLGQIKVSRASKGALSLEYLVTQRKIWKTVRLLIILLYRFCVDLLTLHAFWINLIQFNNGVAQNRPSIKMSLIDVYVF